ncbi:2'-5' RNA ligase family protein [Microbacteriaceae bacterium]|nr:2'-5' RNA ligase family protein [Candidatus Saccharibacteria bacterium]
MLNLLISYPNISKADYDWIQSIRKDHDPRYFSVVKPHITIVFGTNKLTSQELLEHSQKKLKDFSRIAINFDSALVVEDDSKSFFHTFLVPSEGYNKITKLHDLLYEDEMASELRLDIPFIPHIGIGTSDSENDMDSLARQINERVISIQGFLDVLSLVQFDGTKVEDLDKISLS